METFISEQVEVTAYYFKQRGCYPRRIEVNGQPVAVFETGLMRLVDLGKKQVELYSMTDGYAQYDLAHDIARGEWRLMSARQF